MSYCMDVPPFPDTLKYSTAAYADPSYLPNHPTWASRWYYDPQPQWDEMPSPRRPQHSPHRPQHSPHRPQHSPNTSRDISPPRVPSPLFSGRTRMTEQPDGRARSRRRPDAIPILSHPSDIAWQERLLPPSLLCPHSSSYLGTFDVSPPVPERNPLRASSQPNRPSFAPHHRAEYSVSNPSRSPTSSPADKRHVATDSTFNDQDEFSLFVQATAGLGPEQVFRDSPQHLWNETGRPHDIWPPPTPLSEDVVSPVQQTPTTMLAFQHLAQMPQASYQFLPQRPQPHRLLSDPQPSSRVEFWMQQPSEPFERGVNPLDDDLPDYAESQAQAQAAQAVEARRRAQELQQRWRRSHQ